MAGPGGGGRAGGGGRGFSGGSRGGGFHGGGFHGGHAPVGGMYPRRGSGGCCGGFLGMLVLPLFVIFMVIYLLIPGCSTNSYDEEKFQDYANEQYQAEFGASDAYEDNLLITVLVDEKEYYSYYYIAWVGDHVDTQINHMLGNNDTELGQAMEACISETSYKYSLDSGLAQVMETMTEKIRALNLESSFTCSENHAQVKSHLTNHSDVEMTEDTVNRALEAFTEATGIPVVIVVEDMNKVF